MHRWIKNERAYYVFAVTVGVLVAIHTAVWTGALQENRVVVSVAAINAFILAVSLWMAFDPGD